MPVQFPNGPQAGGEGSGYDPWSGKGVGEAGAEPEAASGPEAPRELGPLMRGLSRIVPGPIADRFIRRQMPLPEGRTDAAMPPSSPADQPVGRREQIALYRLRLVDGERLPAGLAPEIISELATGVRQIEIVDNRIRAFNVLLPAIRALEPDLRQAPLVALAHDAFNLRPDTLALRREVRLLASEGWSRLHISDRGYAEIVGALICAQIADRAAKPGGPNDFVNKFDRDFQLPPDVSPQELSELALDIAGMRDERQCVLAFDAILSAADGLDSRLRCEPLLALAYSAIALPPDTWRRREKLRDSARAAWEERGIDDGHYAEILAGLAYSQASGHLGGNYEELDALCADIRELPARFQGFVFGAMFTSEMSRQEKEPRQTVFDSAWAGLERLSDEDAKPGLVALATNLGHLDEDARSLAIERFLDLCEGERAGLAADLAGIALRQIATLFVAHEELFDRALDIVCGERPLDVAPQVLESDDWSPEEHFRLFERLFPVVMERADTPERGAQLATLIAWINEFDPEDQFPSFEKAVEAIARTDMANRHAPLTQARQLGDTPRLNWHRASAMLREVGVESLWKHSTPELWSARFSEAARWQSGGANGGDGDMQRGSQ